jgi:hypothetical protein
MVRATMADLIALLRRAIGDTAGASQVFGDDELQAFLDARRFETRGMRLREEGTLSGGVVLYYDFYSQYENWESGGVLFQPDGTTVAPDTSEWLVGHWQFNAAQTVLPLSIRGKFYDVNAAAADALEAWAGKVSLDFDFSTQGESFSRSQKQKQLLALSQQYRARQLLSVAEIRRGDQ